MLPVSRPVCGLPPGLMQPRARSNIDDAEYPRDASPEKLSRPQKRRRRLQILASHRALNGNIRFGGLDTKHDQADKKSVPCIHNKLDNLETLMQRVFMLVSGQLMTYQDELGAPDWNSCLTELSNAAQFGTKDEMAAKLNSDAAIFVLAASSHAWHGSLLFQQV